MEQSMEEEKKRISVMVSEDNMSAYINLHTFGNSDAEFTYDEVKDALDENGVKMGIDETKLQNILQRKKYDSSELIAVGKESEDGKDGEYEMFFETENLGKPLIREDGSVDYHNMRLFVIVNEGDKLAQYYPPTKGTFGYDVKGKLLIPKVGKPKTALRGKGFVVSEDGNTYYAAMDGKVEYRNFDLNVRNVLTIPGNVDISIGNIDFNGDVEITGNVISGITINAKGSVSIGGHVEAAIIRAGGDIVFKDGVNGKGLARVEAGGSVNARFLENLTVKCKGDVTSNYLLNCNVIAEGMVIVKGKQGSIQGGDVVGMKGVEVGNAGGETGTKTVIRVGVTKAIHQEYADIILKIKNLNTEIDMLESVIEKLTQLKETAPEKFQQDTYNKVFQSKVIKLSEKSKLNEDAMQLCDLMAEAEKAYVKVYKNLHTGARIVVNGATYIPPYTVGGVKIRKLNDKPVVTAIMDDY